MVLRKSTVGHISADAQNQKSSLSTLRADQMAGPEFVGYKDARMMFGLSRTHLYKLGKEGLIRTVSLRGRGTTRGRRLYSVDSIRALLNGLVN